MVYNIKVVRHLSFFTVNYYSQREASSRLVLYQCRGSSLSKMLFLKILLVMCYMMCKILTIFVNSKFILCILASVFLYLDHIEMKYQSVAWNACEASLGKERCVRLNEWKIRRSIC